MRVIYDLGANNGDNIPYYLLRADRVIAVEANSRLSDRIRSRFISEIADGRLVVENIVVTDKEGCETVSFWIHKDDDELSQFPTPDFPERFRRVEMHSRSIVELIRQYGDPFYVKIDLEHFDNLLLQSLFSEGIRPPFISAESHSIEIFATLLISGGYRAFKLVDGATVPMVYRKVSLALPESSLDYSFPPGSAGPFGEDIQGGWASPDQFFRQLAFEGLGWKDIHASSLAEADLGHVDRVITLLRRKLERRLRVSMLKVQRKI